MSFPGNKRASPQKLNPFHGRRLAERGHSQDQTPLSSSCLPFQQTPSSLHFAGRNRLESCSFFWGISPLQDRGAASFLYVNFAPVCKMPRYLVQFDQGHVVSNRGCQRNKGLTFDKFHVWRIPCGQGLENETQGCGGRKINSWTLTHLNT